jgi:hypothetical protein
MLYDARRSSAFNIPIHNKDWVEVARQAYKEALLAIQYGSKKLPIQENVRIELRLAIANELKKRGHEHPWATAWDLVGEAEAEAFAIKLGIGQPLGDLTPQAVIDHFKPLIWSRLAHFGVAADKDCLQAAQLGLLNARASYSRAIDASVGTYAKLHYLIDKEIKAAIRGQDSEKRDVFNEPQVSGDEIPYDNSYEGDEETGERWEMIAKTVLPDGAPPYLCCVSKYPQIAAAIETAFDSLGRLRPWGLKRLPFWLQMWLAETRTRPGEEAGARVDTERSKPIPQTSAEILSLCTPLQFPDATSIALELVPRSVTKHLEPLPQPLTDYPRDRRPMRDPPPPRNPPTTQWQPRTRVQADRLWLKAYHRYLWPRLDGLYQTVHGSHLNQVDRAKRASQKALENLDFNSADKLADDLEKQKSDLRGTSLNIRDYFDDR